MAMPPDGQEYFIGQYAGYHAFAAGYTETAYRELLIDGEYKIVLVPLNMSIVPSELATSASEDVKYANPYPRDIHPPEVSQKPPVKLKDGAVVKEPKKASGSIGSFIASMSKSKGFARPNKYEVVFNLPSLLNSSTDARQLTLHCNTIGWPGHDLQTQTLKLASEPGIEMVQSHAFAGTVSATFYLDTEHSERFLFEQWQELAVNRYTHKANYYNDYIGQMEIYQLSSEEGAEIRTYGTKVHDVYPATISATEYTYEVAEAIQVLTVSFNYRQHYPINIHDGNKYPTI